MEKNEHKIRQKNTMPSSDMVFFCLIFPCNYTLIFNTNLLRFDG